VSDSVSLSDAQIEKILVAIDGLKHSSGIPWQTVIPVFLSSFLGMCVGILLELFRRWLERRKSEAKRAKDELTEINVATVAMAHNLELLIHFTFQNILPHYDDSHAAYQAAQCVPIVNEEIAKFIPSVGGKFPRMMMTSPELNLLEHDFLGKLPFAIGQAPELLQKGNWIVHLSRVLCRYLEDRNSEIALARKDGLRGVTFPDILSAIQVQASIADAECVTMLQLIEQIQIVIQVLEKIGRSYKNAGKLSTVIPPEALSDAIERLRTITRPFVAAMAGGPPNSDPKP
jgi:hypothetical protein